MKIDTNKLSFIVLITFGYGYGVNKSLTKMCMDELKKQKAFLDKPGKRVVESLFGDYNESGCTQHKYVTRITIDGLRTLLFDYIYPSEICDTMGALSAGYGHCAAVSFGRCENTYQFINEGSLYTALCKAKFEYQATCIEAMAGMTDHYVYVTPVLQNEDGSFELCESVYEQLLKCGKAHEIEDNFNKIFEEHELCC